jgi:formylmethanofuran dehydrogenase subunit E
MDLFQKVVAERKGNEEDSAKLRQLWRRASFNMLDIPDDELLKVQRVTVEIPAYAVIFASVTCSVCGESVMEPRIRMKDGRPVCLPCSGQEYYQLDGNGMRLVCS